MITLPYNDMQMVLTLLLRIPDALLENLLRFLHILPVQVYCVAGNFTDGIVLPEDELGGLAVEVVGGGGVLLGLLGEVVGGAAVAGLVRLLCFRGEVLVLALFLPGLVAEALVFCFGGGGGAVVEGWEWVVLVGAVVEEWWERTSAAKMLGLRVRHAGDGMLNECGVGMQW